MAGDWTGIGTAEREAAVARLVARHGASHAGRIAAGIDRVAERWTIEDGDGDAFVAFCDAYFVADPRDRGRLLDRFERALALIQGHLYEIRRGLRRWSDLRGDDFGGVDDLLAVFNPAPDLADQAYRQKLAFVALLNLHRPRLDEMLADGEAWTVDQWAEARVAQSFGPRIPQDVDALARDMRHRADTFVSTFHVPVGTMVDAGGRRWFEPGRKLVAHWLIREQVKAAYAAADGLPLQRALMSVMRRHVDGTIPREVMAGSPAVWDPAANTLDGTPVDPGAVVGPERYARWLDMAGVARALDPYFPEQPTAIARRFELEREIPEAAVERLLVDLLASPVRADLAAFTRRALGRPLEAHDVYFEDVVPMPATDDLNRRLADRFPDHRAFESKLPEVLADLGFAPEAARFYGTRVRVEIAKGAGHAMRPGLPEYDAWLRTNSLDDELGWDGFDIAMHELGHNLEQIISLHRVPRPSLRGVPNTACTEAFAFLYQSLGRQVIGLAPPSPEHDPFDLETVQTALAACQIAGPALVDLYAWRWIYDHPEADAPALARAVIAIAGDVWSRYYAPYFGLDAYHTLAAYQHMVSYPLYLPDYALGHIIAHQIRSHLRGRDLAGETERICGIGRVTPDLWMRRAVGAGLGTVALMDDAAAALARMGAAPL